jgi:hypothetical protein
MTNIGKPKGSELERIEDALVDSLLDASGEDLFREIADLGGTADAVIARVDATIRSARAASALRRLEQAKSELAAWRTGQRPTTTEREAAEVRLRRLRSGQFDADAPMMMAARKGEGLSESDEQGLVEDLAELERLERENSKE